MSTTLEQTESVRSLNTKKPNADDVSIRPAVHELEKAFRRFAPLFGMDMPVPVITIQGGRRKRGWFKPDAWNDRDSHKMSEINVCPEHLDADVHDIAHALLRSMVHYANALDGIDDCRNGTYHNAKYRERAESIGLVCDRVASKGWAYTELTDGLRRVIDAAKIDASAFDIYRQMDGDNKPDQTRMKKWACGCTTVRCSTTLDATCNRCGRPFAYQDKPIEHELHCAVCGCIFTSPIMTSICPKCKRMAENKPPEPEPEPPTPECFTVLGLTLPCTKDDVKDAYFELAASLHPDHGGNAAEFAKVQLAYERALEYLKRNKES